MPFITGLHYELGEQEVAVEQLPDFEAICAEHRLPRAGAIFGWGVARKAQSPLETATRCALKSLSARGRQDVDLLLVATSGLLTPFAEQNRAIGRLVEALEVAVKEVLCVSGAGCASGINALILANQLVSGGLYRDILVVCVDSLDTSIAKFSEYAVFSDGVSSFLVTGDREHAEFGIESSFKQIFLDEMFDMSVAIQKQGGAKEYLQAAARETEAILSNNIFLPVKRMKDSQFGFRKDQLFLKNVARVGHCVSSDCFINLRDYCTSRISNGGFRIALHADAAGHSSAVILRGCSDG